MGNSLKCRNKQPTFKRSSNEWMQMEIMQKASGNKENTLVEGFLTDFIIKD